MLLAISIGITSFYSALTTHHFAIPLNWAILHTFFITIARFFGFRTIPQAQRALSNQLDLVFSLFV